MGIKKQRGRPRYPVATAVAVTSSGVIDLTADGVCVCVCVCVHEREHRSRAQHPVRFSLSRCRIPSSHLSARVPRCSLCVRVLGMMVEF